MKTTSTRNVEIDCGDIFVAFAADGATVEAI